jgi:hypothetical protein
MQGLLIISVILAAVFIAGCSDYRNKVAPPFYSYWIEVDGLEHFYTDAGPANIGFPVPVYNGDALLPFDDNVTMDNSTLYSGIGDTSLRGRGPQGELYHGTRKVEAANVSGYEMAVYEILPTDYYTIGLIDAKANPPNTIGIEYISPPPPDNYTMFMIGKPATTYDPIDASLRYDLGPDNQTARPIIDSLAAKPFSPVSSSPDALYTRWLSDGNVSNYTTYIYIDPALKQKGPCNYSLNVSATFSVTVGHRPWWTSHDEQYVFAIRESIPGNVTGLVPVTVQCFGNMSARDSYEMFGRILP